jgi:aspartyl-tRNA(Asn)/glutamyl-tRNA(Gln) amidotransferase subunit C
MLGAGKGRDSMSITIEQIQHIANLARLEITEEEANSYHAQLSAILDYFQSLQEIDTVNVSPAAGGLNIHNVLRSDETKPGLKLAEVLGNAAKTEENQFQVPPIFE